LNQLVRDLDLTYAHMGVFNKRNLLRVDLIVVLLAITLMVSGLLVLYSASQGGTGNTYYVTRQLVRALIGVLLAMVLICTDYRVLVALAPVMYVGALALLIGVLTFGYEAKGGQHWLKLGPVRLQPSEFSKLVLVYALAWYVSLVKERIRKLHFLALGFVLSGGICGMVFLQGDLGTTAVFGPIIFACLYVGGSKWWHLLLVVLAGVACAPVAWTQLSEYQKDRVRTFLDPGQDPEGDGWQTAQSMITVGSGGTWGKGYRQGTQTQLSYMSENRTDFIFSTVAEEEGFVGATGVLVLFALLLLRGLALAGRSLDAPGGVLIVGCVTIMGVHVFVNVAIALGLLPVTGLPLPLFSYGGSFYLTTMMCLGTILSVHVRRRQVE
jgi:rod shape determining protein RodA